VLENKLLGRQTNLRAYHTADYAFETTGIYPTSTTEPTTHAPGKSRYIGLSHSGTMKRHIVIDVGFWAIYNGSTLNSDPLHTEGLLCEMPQLLHVIELDVAITHSVLSSAVLTPVQRGERARAVPSIN
jgi:hypothetical protein